MLPLRHPSRLFCILFSLFLWAVNCNAQGANKTFEGKSYSIYRVDLIHQKLELLTTDDNGKRLRNPADLKTLGAKRAKQLIFATNSGIFDRTFSPLGLHIEQGRRLVPLNTNNGEGNFFMKPNGVFLIKGTKASIVDANLFDRNSPADYAAQSGPLLLLAGSINHSFNLNSNNRLLRSGVGVRGDSEAIFAISNHPVTFHEFARFFRDELGCGSALYLDGVISVMYAPDIDREQVSGNFAAMFAVFDD
jgi:uncharacterized protein YigE (DUF2233 family)